MSAASPAPDETGPLAAPTAGTALPPCCAASRTSPPLSVAAPVLSPVVAFSPRICYNVLLVEVQNLKVPYFL